MTQRRIVGLFFALLAIAGGLMGSVVLRRSHERAAKRLSERLAQSIKIGVESWLSAKLKTLEGQAAVAAQLTQIKENVISFEPSTLRDGFQSEVWWEPYRHEFSVYGLALDGDKLDVIEGMAFGEFDAGELVRKARATRQTSLYLKAGAKAWPHAAVAAIIDVPRAIPSVLVLARPVDQSFAQEMADKLHHAIVLSDGQSAILAAGNEAELERLKTAVGKEAAGVFTTPDSEWQAVPEQLLPGLTFWTYVSIGDAEDLNQDSQSGNLVIWVAAGALLLVGLGLVFTGGKPVPAPAPAPAPAPLAQATDPGAPGAGPSRPPYDPVRSSSGVTPADTTMNAAGRSDPRLGAAGRSDPRAGGPTGSTDPRALEAEAEGATAVRMAPPVQPANVFGRYKLLDRLGEGGMAEVFTAVAYGAENFRRTFVVKRLRPEMMRNPDVVSAFIDEANLASSLVHNNIVPVFDFGKVGDEYFMATEYILGRDLGRVNRRALDKEQKPLPMALVFYIAQQTLEALDYAHTKTSDLGKPLGIVHRDVSPNNVLVSARGEVKLFDFGIAKAEGRLTQTQFGMVKGNVRFMSPEQARGQAVDSRSDLFSMGLVIYYALSGDALYHADTAYNLLVKAAQGLGGDELANLAKLPKEAQRILERALQPNPADRFQTAAEFATALAPYTNGQKEALARTMDRLFGEDIREEQSKFNAAITGASDPSLRAAQQAAVETDPEGATQVFAQPKGRT